MKSDNVQLFRMLVEAGAQPGEDFSYDLADETCRINERGFILLQNAFPDIDWNEIANIIERDLEQPVQALNQHLGVDFTTAIIHRLHHRLELLPTNEATWYVHQILGGVEQRTGIALYRLVQQTLPTESRQRLEQLLKLTPITQCNVWIEDLVLSAGGDIDDIAHDGEEVLLSEVGITLLNQVWVGDLEVYDELAA